MEVDQEFVRAVNGYAFGRMSTSIETDVLGDDVSVSVEYSSNNNRYIVTLSYYEGSVYRSITKKYRSPNEAKKSYSDLVNFLKEQEQ